MCRTILGLWMFLICGKVWKNGPSQPPCQMGWAFRVMQTRAFLVKWLGTISGFWNSAISVKWTYLYCKWKTARHCQGSDAIYAGQSCKLRSWRERCWAFYFPFRHTMWALWAWKISDHEAPWSIGNFWKSLTYYCLQTEQSLCTVMHKAKQMTINDHKFGKHHIHMHGVTTPHKVCTLPENTVPSTSLRIHRLMATITSKFTLDHPHPLSLSFLVRNCLYGLPDQSPNV